MPPTTYIAIISLALISGLTTLIGAALAVFFKKNVRAIVIGLGFSAGIMLLISLFELIPGSVDSAGLLKTLIAVSFGILLLAALNFIIPHTHLMKEEGKLHAPLLKTAYLVAFGLILHDFPEGFAMANSYIYSPALGVMLAIAIAVHNIPEEFAMAVPLVMAKKRGALFKVAFVSGLAEPAGAILGLFAVYLIPSLNPLFMSFAAGAMIFVSVHELLPMARRYRRIPLFILGLALSVLAYLALAVLIPG